ncbi:MAG: dipicolinate synthase [Oscillospiraceae bacterium]|nr:dipicolinate synthase [Oscillospiraceae bacterium]
MNFALFGGDERSVRLCRLLRQDGHTVRPFALEQALPEGLARPEDALVGADCVIFPLPYEKDGALNAPLSGRRYTPAELLCFSPARAPVLAGLPGAETCAACRKYGLTLLDYGRREDFALRNADLTAEGALALLLDGPHALRGSSVLVAGYGRIGRALAEKLCALGASVTVAERSAWGRAAAALAGCRAVPLSAAAAGDYDTVVNTIPALVFGAAEIEAFGGARLMELASAPYGFDFDAAAAQGKRVLLASNLPGKTAPESAADAVKTTIYSILEELQ